MRAGTPALPVWIPAPRSGSGTGFAGMTILVYQAAPGVIFRGMTWAVPEPKCVDVVGWTGYDALQVG